MKRRTLALALAVSAATTVALAQSIHSGRAQRRGHSEASPSVSVPRRPRSAATVRVLTTEATDLSIGRQAAIVLNVPWVGATKVAVSIAPPNSPSGVVVGSTVIRSRRRWTTRTSVPLSSRVTAELVSCRPLQVVVSVTGPQAQRASGAAMVRTAPPQCGNFFAPTSVWNQALPPNVPLDPESALITGTLTSRVDQEIATHYYPTVNTTSYSVPIYTVPSGQPRVPVILDNPAAYADGLRATLRAGVPIPVGAQPAAGADGQMLIWQPGTDTMWELYRASYVSGQWHAAFGERIDHVSQSPGAYYSDTGIQLGATGSSLALAGGLMTLAEIARGHINHALAFAVPEPRTSVWALPASRSDGSNPSPAAIPEGAHFRLPASLNISALHLPPFVAMMATAVQRYGMIVRDGSPVVSFYAQDPTPTGLNPYPALFGSAGFLARFPWQDLQLLKMDLRTYGDKPVAG